MSPDALTRQILAVARRVSGGDCAITVANHPHAGDLLRVTVESTDESGGEYLRSAVGLTYERALRSLLSVLAQDAANDCDDEPPPPALTLELDGDDGGWPAHACEAFDCAPGFTADDVDGFAMEMAAREADVAGEWRVAS
ncbi:MAG: hypothetical protein Q8S73_36730 [Deltaproteobacteria bacterium]|nr:hypothetical protein [Myxococcales bacterium]MDP3219705.1 hypothetical protein [Deltaproteobacteria bacterium]